VIANGKGSGKEVVGMSIEIAIRHFASAPPKKFNLKNIYANAEVNASE
jgi:hypothetical protein